MSANIAAHASATVPALLRCHRLSLTTASCSILRDIDLTVHNGERVALLGPSGTGKSLLARALAGILPSEVECAGTVSLKGHEIARCHPAQRSASARVSMVDQDTETALSPLHTLGQQVMMVCAGAGQKGCDIRWRAEYLLDQVGISRDLMGRYPAEISGGQRQRVCIALALACDTPLLVADEPTSALDAVSQQHVLNALACAVPNMATKTSFGSSSCGDERPAGLGASSLYPKALLFITHDLRSAQRLCDRGVVLYEGHIVEDASMTTLLESPRHLFTQRMVAAFQREQRQLCAHHQADVAFSY